MKPNSQVMKKKEISMKHGNEALRWVADVLTWSQIPFFLLGETGEKVLMEKDLEVEKVEVGVLDKNFSETTQRLFQGFVKDAELGDVIRIDKDGVPVEIKIIKKHYKFFENPDTVFYMADEYKIPNPWHKYWKSRYLIQ